MVHPSLNGHRFIGGVIGCVTTVAVQRFGQGSRDGLFIVSKGKVISCGCFRFSCVDGRSCAGYSICC